MDVLDVTARALRKRPHSRLLQSAAWRLCERATSPRVGYLRSGARMHLELGEYIDRHIFMYDTYEDSATRLLERTAFPGWRFVDVGACEGYFAVLAAALGGPTSRVVAIEPNQGVVQRLRRTVALDQLPISIVEAACGNVDGVLPLTISAVPGNAGMSSLVRADVGDHAEKVRVRRLDEICHEMGLEPDVVKIDVEGFQEEVLAGFSAILSSRPPRLLLVEAIERDGVVSLLEAYGYDGATVLPDGTLASLDAPRSSSVDLIAFALRS